MVGFCINTIKLFKIQILDGIDLNLLQRLPYQPSHDDPNRRMNALINLFFPRYKNGYLPS